MRLVGRLGATLRLGVMSDQRRMVCWMSDPHGNAQVQAFLLSLLSDPRFPGTVNDIVIETASARYQDAIDRFVRGDDVQRDVLRKAWEAACGERHSVWRWPKNPDSVDAFNAFNSFGYQF